MKKKLKWYSFRLRVVVLAASLITLAVGYFAYRCCVAVLLLPMGEGPAGPAVSAEHFEKVWSEERVVLIGVGDSVTRGLGASARHTYFNLLIKNDDEQYPDMKGKSLGNVLPRLEADNRAQDYSVTVEHLERQLPKIEVYPEDVKGVIVITSGGNDLIHDYGRSEPKDGAMYGAKYEQAAGWVDNMKGRIRKLVEGLGAKFPGGCEIFLANIYDPTDGASDPEWVGLPKWKDGSKIVGLANEKIAEVCAEYENVHLVDIHSEFLGHGIHCLEFWRKNYRWGDATWWYFTNLEDPNRRGYDAIRRLFLSEMVKVLPGKLEGLFSYKKEGAGI